MLLGRVISEQRFLEDRVLLGWIISEQRFLEDRVLLGRVISEQRFLEDRVLLGWVISEQRFAVSIIGPLILYVHSYVIMQMDNWPIRARVFQSQCHLRHRVTSQTHNSPPRPTPNNKCNCVFPCRQRLEKARVVEVIKRFKCLCGPQYFSV